MKNSLEGFKGRFEQAEERINYLKYHKKKMIKFAEKEKD